MPLNYRRSRPARMLSPNIISIFAACLLVACSTNLEGPELTDLQVEFTSGRTGFTAHIEFNHEWALDVDQASDALVRTRLVTPSKTTEDGSPGVLATIWIPIETRPAYSNGPALVIENFAGVSHLWQEQGRLINLVNEQMQPLPGACSVEIDFINDIFLDLGLLHRQTRTTTRHLIKMSTEGELIETDLTSRGLKFQSLIGMLTSTADGTYWISDLRDFNPQVIAFAARPQLERLCSGNQGYD